MNESKYLAVPESRLIWRHWAEDAERTEAEPLTLVYDLASDYTHLMNPLGAAIIRMLQESPMTAAEVTAKLTEEFEADEPIQEKDIQRFLDTLMWKGVLEMDKSI